METTTIKSAGVLGFIAGAWLMVSSYMMGLGFSSNEFVVGLLVALFAAIEFFSVGSAMWTSWASGILGAWLLVSPLFFAGMTVGAIWNAVVVGIVILAVAIWGGYSASSTMGMGHPKMG